MEEFPPYSPDELAAVHALSVEDVAAIDTALLAHASPNWQKVAMVVVGAMYAYPDRYEEIPDHYYGRRILALVELGQLESRGNLSNMRASELRLLQSNAGA